MLLKIYTDTHNATDLSFLLHKHPDKLQTVDLSFGKAHIFYPKATETECEVALLLDIDTIALVRNNMANGTSFSLAHYVNDRPYVASSFMSTALAKAFSTAMNGRCNNRPELIDKIFSFSVHISVLPAPKGGKLLINKLFEPLGYEVTIKPHQLDNKFPDWGVSKYFTVVLRKQSTIKDLLTHLYVLIPVLDNNKHYWVSKAEVDKLLQKGEGWLNHHPENKQITNRYLKGIKHLSNIAFDQLFEEVQKEGEEIIVKDEKRESLHTMRLKTVFQELQKIGVRTVIDLGCGEGKLLKILLKSPQFEKILGVDVSTRSIEIAKDRLHWLEMPPKQRERIELMQGAITYRDRRLEGYEAAVLVEVIEHLDEDRLDSFEKSIFYFAKPLNVIVTTPNGEYNKLFEGMGEGEMRHEDHRFEWSRKEFSSWAKRVANEYGYDFELKPLGLEEEKVGAPSQMAVFKLK